MDDNSVRTSVVIKLPNEEEPDGVNTYKIDLEDVESPKEYVIDQLFSDDEIAVYAVFEASDFTGEKPQRKITSSNFSQFKFSHKKSYARKKEKSVLMEPGEPWTDQLNYLPNADIHLEKNFTNMRKAKKCIKLKSTSKGVNTDINQSPKLLEEVRKAVSLNFSKIKGKTTDLSSIFTVKSLSDLREMMNRASSTTFILDEENLKQKKKTPPNIIIVPVVIKDGELHNFWKDYKSQEPQSLSQSSEKSVAFEKISTSTSTESFPLCDNNKVAKSETLQNDAKIDEKNDNSKSQEYLLEEIKNLQKKFNSLLKSLESIGFTFSEKKETEDKTPAPEESKLVRKSLNKFDEIPVFSPETKFFLERKDCNEKMAFDKIEEDLPLIVSNSKSVITNFFDYTEMIDDYDEEEKTHFGEVINWEESNNLKKVRLSKSENCRCTRSKHTSLKKSFSMDLGVDIFGLKKPKNLFFKLESLKKKEKSKIFDGNDELWFADKLNEAKLHNLPKYENVKVKSETNDFTVNANAVGLLKNQKNQSNKGLEKETLVKPTPSRINTKTNNADLVDLKEKTSKKLPKNKLETKTLIFQEEKQNVRSVTRRVSVKDNPLSKLHVNLLIKSHQNCEQKNNQLKCQATRLPRVSCQKKDQKMGKKEKNSEVEQAAASAVPVRKNLELKETRNEAESPKKGQTVPTSQVVVELFSKKPSSLEDFYSEIDLQCLYNYDTEAKENPDCQKNNGSNNDKKPVVKSVWALTKLLLFEDGTKKMEVLEASLNPPDYRLNQNSTEDKIR